MAATRSVLAPAKRLTETPLRMQARLLRRWLRRRSTQIRYQRWSLDGIPVLFANSFPKSGTHLLTQILQAFTRLGPAVDSGLPAVVTFAGDSGQERANDQIIADLQRFLPGDIGYGHLHAGEEVRRILEQERFAHYLVLRDPRDIVVSHVHYVSEIEPRHIHHDYYTRQLHHFGERLTASIVGFESGQARLPDIRRRYEPFLDWLEVPGILVLKYEDLLKDQNSQLERIIAHAVQHGFPLSITQSRALAILSAGIQPQRSPTFRKGGTGGWKDQFTPEHKQLFKNIGGDLLIRLSYEKSNDW